jgi:hypothetical protein
MKQKGLKEKVSREGHNFRTRKKARGGSKNIIAATKAF